MCHFVLVFLVLIVLRLPRFGKRELILVLFVRLFDLCLFGFVGFLFLLGSGKGCGLWLWHSLDFSLNFFFKKSHVQREHEANNARALVNPGIYMAEFLNFKTYMLHVWAAGAFSSHSEQRYFDSSFAVLACNRVLFTTLWSDHFIIEGSVEREDSTKKKKKKKKKKNEQTNSSTRKLLH